MGRWGELFFEGDSDLDLASDISMHAGIELYNYEVDPKDAEYESGGKGQEATRQHLDSGVFTQLFEKYRRGDGVDYIYEKELYLILLTVLGMRLGVTISPDQMAILRSLSPRVSPKYSLPLADSGFRGPMKDQFDTALKFYKNGVPYDFYADRCEAPHCRKAVVNLDEGGGLKKCSKCLEVFYCGKECQTSHWSNHKKVCMTPAKRAEIQEKASGGRGWISLNV